MASSSSLWTEHKMPDGRVYYFNKQTKQSVWEKPDELKSPSELILSRCEWRAHKTPEGKQYYYNTQTKVTSWTKPLVRHWLHHLPQHEYQFLLEHFVSCRSSQRLSVKPTPPSVEVRVAISLMKSCVPRLPRTMLRDRRRFPHQSPTQLLLQPRPRQLQLSLPRSRPARRRTRALTRRRRSLPATPMVPTSASATSRTPPRLSSNSCATTQCPRRATGAMPSKPSTRRRFGHSAFVTFPIRRSDKCSTDTKRSAPKRKRFSL